MTVQYDEESTTSPPSTGSSARLKCYFSRQNRKAPEDSEIGTPPTYIALSWYASEEQLIEAVKASTSGKVATFKLLKDFKAA